MSDDEVIRVVSTSFVPVAVNLYRIREDRGPGGELFRSVQRQMDQYQGFWVVSPEGKALAKYHDWRGDPSVPLSKRVLMMLEDSLKALGAVKPRSVKRMEPLPYRGKGVQPDGSVNVALYGRLLYQGRPDGPMMLDSVTFAASEWAQFAPPKKAGAQGWTLPQPLACSLARSLLAPGDSAGVFRPEDFTQAEVQAKVASVESGKARILLSGKWKATGLYGGEKSKPHGASAAAEGIALYDLEKKSMRSLFMLFDGKVWGESEQRARATGGVVEWTFETAGETSKP